MHSDWVNRPQYSSQHSLPDDDCIREFRIGMGSTSSPDRFELSALIAPHAGLAGDASPAERDRLRARMSENPAIAHYAAVLARCDIFGGCGAGTLLAYQAWPAELSRRRSLRRWHRVCTLAGRSATGTRTGGGSCRRASLGPVIN